MAFWVFWLALDLSLIVVEWICPSDERAQIGPADAETAAMFSGVLACYSVFGKAWNLDAVDRIAEFDSPLGKGPIDSSSNYDICIFVIIGKVRLEPNHASLHVNAGAEALEGAATIIVLERIVPEDAHVSSI